MGDGRYYTYYQFWGIVILVLLSFVVLLSLIIGYYKNRGNKNDIQLFYLFIGLSGLVMIKIVEFVIPSLNKGMILRSLFAIGLFLLVFEWFIYLNVSFLHFKKSNRRNVVWGFLIISSIIALITKGDLFFKEYQFFNTTFNLIYFFWCLILTINAFILVVISATVRRKIHNIYSNFTVTSMLLVFSFLPLLLYTIAVYMNVSFIDFAEIFLLLMLTASFNIVMYNQAPSGITVLTFEKIVDIINDYIIVTDQRGKIIYRNKAVSQSDFFVEKESIHVKQMDDIYKAEAVIKKDGDGEEYIHLIDGEDNYYFGHQVEALKNQDDIIGYIITIVDISELVELLNQLKDIELQAKDVNEQLVNYAEIVYNVEKEKQINVLLERILSSREEDIRLLTEQIDTLINHVETDETISMQDQIDHVIKYNQQIINEVRKTVNSYR